MIHDQNQSHTFLVTVDGCTAEEAQQVIAERTLYDEDYGFDYTISAEEHRAPDLSMITSATVAGYEITIIRHTGVTRDGVVCETGYARFTGKTPVEWVTGLAQWLVTGGMVDDHLAANAQAVLDDLENYRDNADDVGAQLEAPHMMMSLVTQLTEDDPAWRIHTRALD